MESMNSSKRSRSDSNRRRGFLFRLVGSISIGKAADEIVQRGKKKIAESVGLARG